MKSILLAISAFVALSLVFLLILVTSFALSFLLNDDAKNVAIDGSSMVDEYQEWLTSNIQQKNRLFPDEEEGAEQAEELKQYGEAFENIQQKDEQTEYQELKIPELVNLMKAVPLPSLPDGEEW